MTNVETKNGNQLFHGDIFDVIQKEYESPEQGQFKRQIVELHSNAVAMLMRDYPTNTVYVTSEFRAGINKVIESIPAGKIDNGESPEEAMIREIKEETGFILDSASQIQKITTINSSEGFTNEKVTLFVVNDDFNIKTQHDPEFDHDEFITGKWVPFDQWYAKVMNSTESYSAPAVITALWVASH